MRIGTPDIVGGMVDIDESSVIQRPSGPAAVVARASGAFDIDSVNPSDSLAKLANSTSLAAHVARFDYRRCIAATRVVVFLWWWCGAVALQLDRRHQQRRVRKCFHADHGFQISWTTLASEWWTLELDALWQIFETAVD